MLTNATVKAARPGARPYKMGDAGGLFLLVTPGGRKSWRMKFRIDRREKLLTFGDYPELGLGEARERRDQAREQLRRGEDPSGARRRAIAAAAEAKAAELAAETFEPVARRWHAAQLVRWSPVHAADVLTSFERDVFPAIGAMPVAAITAREVLELLRAVEARDAIETARRLRQRISAVFRFAIPEGSATHDPAALVAQALSPLPPPRPQAAFIDLTALRELMAAADAAPAPALVKLASRFLALTGVRLDAVRGARRVEFEDIDWTGAFVGPRRPLWRVPPARLKLSRRRKADPAAEHLIPLSVQAEQVLRDAFAITGPSEHIFPGRIAGRPIGEGAIGDLYEAAGYAGRHVPHGWRASFSTILNEKRLGDRDLIDQTLGHAPKDKVEAAYNRAKHLYHRRLLFHRWAELLLPA